MPAPSFSAFSMKRRNRNPNRLQGSELLAVLQALAFAPKSEILEATGWHSWPGLTDAAFRAMFDRPACLNKAGGYRVKGKGAWVHSTLLAKHSPAAAVTGTCWTITIEEDGTLLLAPQGPGVQP